MKNATASVALGLSICLLTLSAAGAATGEVDGLRRLPKIAVAWPGTAPAPLVAPLDGLAQHFRVVGLPGPEPLEKKQIKTSLTSFSTKVVVRRHTYKPKLVGSSPFAKRAKNVTIATQIIPVEFVFPDGTDLDPTAGLPSCAGFGTAFERTMESPLFQDLDYGEGVGRQFAEYIRRIEFWKYTGPGALNPRYSVRLSPSAPVSYKITLPDGYTTHDAPCGRVGIVDLDGLLQLVSTQLLPQLKKYGVSPKTFPIFLFLNVATQFPDGSLALGFHSWANSGGYAQTYGVALYDGSHAFTGSNDIAALSHEIMEWYDDPFTNNATPPWGNLGQVRGCQANLEVADPLTGNLFEIEGGNGFTYHPQETAFFSWFFDQVPSIGVNGTYSSGGTFDAPAELCQ